MAEVIAEIGCNHKGSLDNAVDFIKTAAKYCRVPTVKFQKRNVKELLTEEQYNAKHPVPRNSYGESYGEHREFLEFDIEQHKYLKTVCEEYGAEYSCSVWDLTSAKEISSLSPKKIKIPSACNLKFDMLEWLCINYHGDIHLSVGMTTREEIDNIVKFFVSQKRNKDLTLYSCTAGYPVDFEDICLLEISYLKNTYSDIIKDVGFSGHHLGIAVDIAALTLGASFIERHFTLDRTWKGTDHAASLEPDGMRKLVRDISAAKKALSYKSSDMLPVESIQRNKFGK
jgi:sialic acid synthase